MRLFVGVVSLWMVGCEMADPSNPDEAWVDADEQEQLIGFGDRYTMPRYTCQALDANRRVRDEAIAAVANSHGLPLGGKPLATCLRFSSTSRTRPPT